MNTVHIILQDLPRGQGVVVQTTAAAPAVGQPLSPAQALGTDLLRTCQRQAQGVVYGCAPNATNDFLRDITDPEVYGWSIPAEVRARASQLLHGQPG